MCLNTETVDEQEDEKDMIRTTNILGRTGAYRYQT